MVEIHITVRSKVATGRYKSGVVRNIVTIASIKSYCHNHKKYSEIVRSKVEIRKKKKSHNKE